MENERLVRSNLYEQPRVTLKLVSIDTDNIKTLRLFHSCNIVMRLLIFEIAGCDLYVLAGLSKKILG